MSEQLEMHVATDEAWAQYKADHGKNYQEEEEASR